MQKHRNPLKLVEMDSSLITGYLDYISKEWKEFISFHA